MDHAMLHGVNLAGWLVLEPWVTPSLFASSGAFDEEGLEAALGHDRYVEVVAGHRSAFIGERDFRQIADRGYNAVRIPVPWTVFGKDGPMPGVDEGCIEYVDRAFTWAEAAGLQVLLVLAAMPGGDDDPEALSNVIAMGSTLRDPVIEVVARLAERYAERDCLIGIEPLDEPVAQRRRGLSVTPGVPMHMLRNFYRDCYEAVRDRAGDHPVVVFSCAGRPDMWNLFMAQSRYRNVWLDLHLYHYNDVVDASGPSGTRRLVERSSDAIARARRSGLPVVVGEWSSSLPVGAGTPTPEGLKAMERVYAAAQIQAFRDASGWFFQTWKTENKLSAWDARVALSSFERGMFD